MVDLGVRFDNNVTFRYHMSEKINKAYSVSGISFEFYQSLLHHLSYLGTKLNLQIQHAGVPLTYKVM